MEFDLSILQQAGLTEGEAKVYLALLKTGFTTTGPLIDKARVAKSIIYQILDKLIEKGLVSYAIKNNVKHFKAEDPGKIIEFLEKKQEELLQKTKEIKQYLPELEKLRKKEEETSIQVYEGFKGVQSCFNHTQKYLEKGEEYFILGLFAQQDQKYHNYWMQTHIKRQEKGFAAKMLFNKYTPREVLENRNSYSGCDSRYMHNTLKTPAWILTYKNITTLFLQDKDLAVEIVNQEIADTFQAYFKDYWSKSKKLE
jgi:sugar-specific transcriptional regulator TrmB